MYTLFFTKKRRGSALTYGLIIMTIVAIIFYGLIQFVISSIRLSLRAEPDAQALHIAEAGVYFYRWHLAHNVEGKTATQVAAFWTANPLAVDDDGDGDCDDDDAYGSSDDDDADTQEWYTADYNDGSADVGQYRVCVTPPSQYSTIVTITSTGWSNKNPDLKHTVQARLRKPSWSEYAILSNEFLRLSSGTEIFGPIHANEGFHFDGVSHNVITSSVETYFDSDSDINGLRPGVWAADVNDEDGDGNVSEQDPDESEHFLAGKKFPVIATDFDNASADFNVMKTQSQVGGGNLYFDTSGVGRYIKLGSPTASQMEVRRVTGYNSSTFEITSWEGAQTYSIPVEGIVYVEENVWIEGTLPAGTILTVAAHNPSASYERNIFVGMGDILYEDNEDENVPAAILGLASENNVQIMRYIKGDTSTNSSETLRIDAALLAQKGYIGWQSPSGVSWNNTIDTVTINGALVSSKRLGFGYTSGTGFTNRNLIFDAELLFQPPPLFPAGDSYAIDLWENID